MLVVARKEGESLLIGDDIEITIAKLNDGSVKMAIDAPKELKILRKELYLAVGEENKSANLTDLSILKKLK